MSTPKHLSLLMLLASFVAHSPGHVKAQNTTKVLPTESRDDNGRLQSFDCSFMELGAKQHKCDALTFGRYLKTARTAAVTIGNVPPGGEGKPLRKYAEDLLRKWGRFRLVPDLDSADLVFQLRQFALRFRYNPLTKTQELRREPLRISEILVWPRGADPERDDVLWLDLYSGEWPRSDTVAGVMRLLRRDVEDAEKQVSK